jgi:hypothetical protein
MILHIKIDIYLLIPLGMAENILAMGSFNTCKYMHIYILIFTYTYEYINISIYMYTYILIYITAHINKYRLIYLFLESSLAMGCFNRVDRYICFYRYSCILKYIYICSHTYINLPIPFGIAESILAMGCFNRVD